MNENYHIRLAKERFVFCAAHFITYDQDVCEPLHGHNFHVAVELEGPLEANRYVVDFIRVRDLVQEIVDKLDHRMLLPMGHPTIQVEVGKTEVEVRHGARRWVFPRKDCVLLPLENTTAELLAHYIATEIRQSLVGAEGEAISRLEVAVDECDGQWGVYTAEGGPGATD